MSLNVENLNAHYGKAQILFDIGLSVEEGEMVCLLGRNGVGKSTFLKSIMGLVNRSGSIFFRGKDISRLQPYEIARMGLSYLPEDRGIYPELNVWDNFLLSSLNAKKRNKETEREIHELFPWLKERLKQKGATLSGGELQMLAIARALLGEPGFMLIDEFSSGLQPSFVTRIADVLTEINRKKGISVLLVEQNTDLALRICQRAYVIEKGRIVHSGPSQELSKREDLLKQHLVI